MGVGDAEQWRRQAEATRSAQQVADDVLALDCAAALDIADGVVVAVRSVLNPDKLTHVAPL